MNNTELERAIEQAWNHTQKTEPGAALIDAERHLQQLRFIQRLRSETFELSKREAPKSPTPPPTKYGI